MPTKRDIQKRGNDRELQRLIKNFNAKITRESKKAGMNEYLPDKVSKKEILASVENKTELNRIKRSLESFTKRGSTELVELPNGVKATKYAVDELKKSVKNFNSKNLRAFKQNDEIREYLPDRVSVKDVYEKMESAKDVSRETKAFQRFSKKDALDVVKSKRGAKALKWEIEETKIKEGLVNEEKAKKRERIEKTPVSIGGESTDVTRAEMGKIKDNSLRDTNKNFENLSQKEWELHKRHIDNMLNAKYKKEHNEIMRENYIRGLRENGFLDNNNLEDIIRSIDFDTFITTVETDETATFDFYKEPQAWETRMEYINNAWTNAYNQFLESSDNT